MPTPASDSSSLARRVASHAGRTRFRLLGIIPVLLATVLPGADATGSVVQIDLTPLLNARPVATLAQGKVVPWSGGVDGHGRLNGYLTMAASLSIGDQDPKALPDDPLIPGTVDRPEMLLHYANEIEARNQAVALDREATLTIPVTPQRYRSLFLAVTSSEGSAKLAIELTYADGVPGTATVTVPDYWHDPDPNDARIGILLRDLAKWNPANRMTEKGHHYIDTVNLKPDPGRALKSLQITKSGASYLVVWAVTAVAAP